MNFSIGMAFIVVSLMYCIGLSIFYFTKQHARNYETQLFSCFLPANLIGLLLELFCSLSIVYNGVDDFSSILLSKLYLIYLIFFGLLLLLYVYVVCVSPVVVVDLNEKQRKVRNVFIGLFILSSLVTLFLPIELQNANGSMYASGFAVYFVFALSGFANLYCGIKMIFNYGVLKKRKCIPLIANIVIAGVMAIIQQKYPEFTVATSVETFVIFLMYNTIENPEVRMIQELEETKDAADRANQAKTDFLSGMSHEIRTPLNAIIGFSDCIMDTNSLDEAKENAKDIANASHNLLETVNGILDISKIEVGKSNVGNIQYNAYDTFEELAKLATPMMQEKGLEFSYKFSSDLPKVLFGNQANLKKIVMNLLHNACKGTEIGFVHYEVSCVNTDDVCQLLISVEDSGNGIPKENVNEVFASNPSSNSPMNDGTGIGLAITKQLVELMGGRIIVHTIYGEGSKFTVILDQKIEEGPEKSNKKKKATLDLEDVRILLVDDTPLNLKVACKLLKKYGANQIVTCESGFECLERIEKGEQYDVILLDDMMPKMSGVVTLQNLKDVPGFHIPTIALTANAIVGMKEKYLEHGFDDYLSKPIQKDRLIQVMNQVLGRDTGNDVPFSSFEVQEDSSATEKDSTEEKKEEAVNELIPVVSPDLPEQTPEKVDRSYLEEHGVDVDHALELLGDMEMYNATISDFLKEVEEKWARIVQYKDDCNMSDYAIEVHSLKSDSKYLGFMKLADISYQHELKSKENDMDFVLNNFKELEDEYKKILKIAKEYVEHNPVQE